MARGKPVSDYAKGQVMAYSRSMSIRKIAEIMKIPKSTVSDIIKRNKNGKHKNKDRSGRPKLSNPRQDRALVLRSLRDRWLTAPVLKNVWAAETGVVASTSTVKRRLADAGLNGRIARRKPLLQPRHKIARLQWAREHKDWTMEQWNSVVWSDESKFNIFQSDGRTYVRRRKSEEFDEGCVVGTVKHGGGSVMVWGCMCGSETGMMLRVETRMDRFSYLRVLEDGLVPSAGAMRGLDYSFMHDNAPCHRAHVVSDWLEEQEITILSWPAQSPDLNPIENLWDHMERQLEKMPSTTKEGLWKNLQVLWSAIPPETIQNLVSSMPRRVAAVIKAKGGHTKY